MASSLRLSTSFSKSTFFVLDGSLTQEMAERCDKAQSKLAHQGVVSAGRILLPSDPLFSDNTLPKRFEDSPEAYLTFFTERQVLLHDYAEALTQLLDMISSDDEKLVQKREAIQGSIKRVKQELAVIGNLIYVCDNAAILEANKQELDTVLKAHQSRETQLQKIVAPNHKIEGEPLIEANAQLAAWLNGLQQHLADFNQQRYMLYVETLRAHNTDIVALKNALPSLENDIAEAARQVFIAYPSKNKAELTAALEAAKRQPTHADRQTLGSDKTVDEYLELVTARQEKYERLRTLNKTFRLTLLQLQQEERCAREVAGYPDDYSWVEWAKQRAGVSVSKAARPHPFQLVLEHQLAQQGMTSIADAYKHLGEAVAGMNVEKLKMMSGSLHAWALSHPWEARQLAGNLQHVYDIVTRDGAKTFGAAVTDMVLGGWERGTVENIAQDMLQGKHDELAGMMEFAPMPAELIALLDLAGYLPYVANVVQAERGKNLAGLVGDALSSVFKQIPGVGSVLSKVFTAGLGIIQTKAEIKFAQGVGKRHDLEVTVNALFKGLKSANADPAAFCKEVASYALKRELLLQAGTVATDIREVGKIGVLQRRREEMALWWKHLTGTGKAGMALVIGAPVLIGAGAVAVSAVTALIGVSVTLLSIAMMGLAMPRVLGLLAKGNLFGLYTIQNRVYQEMNNTRLQKAITKLRHDIRAEQQKLAKKRNDLIVEKQAELPPSVDIKVKRADAQQDIAALVDNVLGYQGDATVQLDADLLATLTKEYGDLTRVSDQKRKEALDTLSQGIVAQFDAQISALDKQFAQKQASLVEQTMNQQNAYMEGVEYTVVQRSVNPIDENTKRDRVRYQVHETATILNKAVLKEMADRGLLDNEILAAGTAGLAKPFMN